MTMKMTTMTMKTNSWFLKTFPSSTWIGAKNSKSWMTSCVRCNLSKSKYPRILKNFALPSTILRILASDRNMRGSLTKARGV